MTLKSVSISSNLGKWFKKNETTMNEALMDRNFVDILSQEFKIGMKQLR